ncbi:MAG: right-handed parallel beta-helix repeat-containing protein [Dehalococcoidales bacterium]|nr:right-handed parallel beta-helix repeat-containing protein [Dehalococcoidales bacterium]
MGQVIALILLLLFTTLNPACAQSYYVDATSGNDSWLGTSVTGPWRTLDKVNKSTFLPGDIVYFKCGEIWREPLLVPSSGANSKPITLTGYGSCSPTIKPEINAADIIGNWSLYSGNIYVANVGFEVKQLFVDGRYLRLSQYPNHDSPYKGYLYITADSVPRQDVNGNTAHLDLTDTSLNSIRDKDMLGAGIHIKTINWRIEDKQISAFDPANYRLSWETSTGYPIKKGYGYYLDNKLWMLDQPGEWYYDKSLGKVYAWLPDGSNPSLHRMEASRYDFGIRVLTKNYVVVNGLRVRYAAGDGIAFSASQWFTAKNLEILDSGQDGISIVNQSRGWVDGNIVKNSVREGIDVRNSDNVSVIWNRVENSGTVGSPKYSYAAIDTSSSFNAQINNNTIINAGYIGIHFTKQSTIRNNVIENTCLVLDDCAAIYTNNAKDPDPPNNSEVSENIIINSVGNTDGRPYIVGGTLAAGIYLDALANGVTVTDNVILNTDRGIYLNSASNNIIRGNTLYGNRLAQIKIDEYVSPNVLRGNTITGNVLFPLNANAPISLRGLYSNINFGYFDYNTYSSLYSEKVIEETYKPGWPADQTYLANFYTLADWQKVKGMELNGSFQPFAILPYKLTPVTSANIIANSTFGTNISPWSKWSYDSAASISWRANCGANGGCLQFTSSQASSSLCNSNTFSLQQGKTYMLEFKLAASAPNQGAWVILRRNGPTYESAGFQKYITSGTEWQTYSFEFKATATLTNMARLDFNLPAGGQTIYIDDVVVKEIVVKTHSTFDTDGSFWSKYSADNLATMSALPNCSVYGDCLKFTSSPQYRSVAFTSGFSLILSKTYSVEFKLLAGQANQAISINVRRNGPTYETAGLIQTIYAGTAWQKYMFTFTAWANMDAARIDFDALPGQSFYLDDVIIKEGVVQNNNLGDDSRIMINKSSLATIFNCEDTDPAKCGEYIYLNGNPVYWPVSVPPYSSAIIIWKKNPFRQPYG